MKKESPKKHSFFKNVKFRNGAFSVSVTLIVICLCIVICAIGDTAEKHFALQKDYSFNGAATQSSITAQQLELLDKDVHIYLITSVGNSNKTLTSLLTRYAAITPHLTFSEENLSANPLLFTRFQDLLGENEVSSDCLIVDCEKTGRSRIISAEDFMVYSYNPSTGYYYTSGINYDKPLTEAIVFVAQEEPLTLQLLRGHNELSGENLSVPQRILTQANYELKDINLLHGDLLNPDYPLLILCPQLDFSKKELEMLMQFADLGGNFFIVSGYTDPLHLENYNAFLRTYGISFFSGLTMAKSDDTQSYYDDKQAFLMPRMLETEVTQPLIDSGKDTLVLPGSRALRLPENKEDSLTVEPLMITGRAYVRDYVNTEPDIAAQQETDEEGYFTLAVLSTRVTESGNVSKAHIIGNSLMFTDYWLDQNTYSSDYLLRALRHLQGKSPISLDISSKPIVREPLTLGSLAPSVAVICLVPLLILVLALLILIPRKHL